MKSITTGIVLLLLMTQPLSAQNKTKPTKDETIAVIKKLGGKITFDQKSPGIAVRLNSQDVTDATLAQLSGLTGLQRLELIGAKITDDGLLHLKALPNLKSLLLRRTAVTNAGVKKLQQALPKCEILVDGLPGHVMVNGYGDAFHQLKGDFQRLMRTDNLLVVWLFDESVSMQDDQKEIANIFPKVFAELQITKGPKTKRIANAKILNTVYGFGEALHLVLPPTADTGKVVTSIRDKIAVDKSGKENMCIAIGRAITTNRKLAAKQKRRLVVIVVTDESGDNGTLSELVIQVASRPGVKAPVYFLGREAIFGYPYARVRWVDPKYKMTHWLRINRGPETAFAESLQWDGLHERWDAFSSGFGPYEQVRIARETDGIFFVLPSEEYSLVGADARMQRLLASYNMREYHPAWQSRSQYARERQSSEFRKTIWDIIVAFNPTKNEAKLIPGYYENLNIRDRHYPLELPAFKKVASHEIVKVFSAWNKLNLAIQLLDSVEPLRDKEKSKRWQANYGLIKAQCLAYRIRLFQLMLVLDNHITANPPRKVKPPRPGRKPSNEWLINRDRRMIIPNAAQYQRIKTAFKLKLTREEFLEKQEKDIKKSRELYQLVITRHKNTPWARRANYELRRGFGMRIDRMYWNPNYSKLDVKLPKL
jgi:hypothetical protein